MSGRQAPTSPCRVCPFHILHTTRTLQIRQHYVKLIEDEHEEILAIFLLRPHSQLKLNYLVMWVGVGDVGCDRMNKCGIPGRISLFPFFKLSEINSPAHTVYRVSSYVYVIGPVNDPSWSIESVQWCMRKREGCIYCYDFIIKIAP